MGVTHGTGSETEATPAGVEPHTHKHAYEFDLFRVEKGRTVYRGFHPRLFKWKPCGLLQRQVDGLQESDLRANEDGRLLYDATVSVDDREYAIRTDNDGSLIRVDYKGQAAEERALAVEDVSAWPDHPRLDDGRLEYFQEQARGK